MKNIRLFIPILFYFVLFSFTAASLNKTDSLQAEYVKAKDQLSKIDILIELEKSYHLNDEKKARQYIGEALKIAKKIQSPLEVGRCFIQLGDLHRIYRKEGEKPEISISFYDSALQIGLSEKDYSLQAAGNNGMGMVYMDLGDFEKGGKFLKNGVALESKAKKKIMLSRYIYNLALYHELSGNYETAIKDYHRSFDMAEQNKDEEVMMRAYTGLGFIAMEQAKNKDCEFFFSKALEISYKLNSVDLTNLILVNLADIATKEGNYKKSLDYQFKALKIAERGESLTLSVIYRAIGRNYTQLGEYKKAEDYFMRSLEIGKKNESSQDISGCYYSLAEVSLYQKKFEAAIKNVDLSLAITKEFNQTPLYKDALMLKAQILEKSGNYKEGIAYYKQYYDLRDSMMSENEKKNLNELQVKYETEKKEKEIKVLSQKAQIDQLKFNQQRLYLFGVIGLVILAAIVIYILYKQRNLGTNQKAVKLEQQLLRSQMNPHFIFNALTSIQEYIYSNEPKEAGKYLSKFGKLMRLILENSREENVTLENEITTLELYFQLQKLRFGNKLEYFIDVDPNLDTENVLIPPMFAQPFIENSLEHGIAHKPEGGKIWVRFRLEDESLVFEVEDNGIGRERAKEIMTSRKPEHKSFATTITQERLGLINSRKNKKVSLDIKDSMDEENNVKGTRTTFSIPVEWA